MKKSAWMLVAVFAMSILATGVVMAEEGKTCSKGNFLCSIGSGIKNSPVGQFFTKKSDEYKTRKTAGK